MTKYLLNIVVLLVWIIVGTSVGLGADGSFEPWEFGDAKGVTEPRSDVHRENISLPSQAVIAGLNLFSNYISQVDGDRCPMYPTCASYSRQAVRKHGFIMGIVMTADRLIHEGNEMDYAPLIQVGSSVRFYDPVQWNDYWWYSGNGPEK